jgi:hypothetical protein
MIVLCNCSLPDDGPVRPETCRSLGVLKHCCNSNEVCVFFGLYFNKNYRVGVPGIDFLSSKLMIDLVLLHSCREQSYVLSNRNCLCT